MSNPHSSMLETYLGPVGASPFELARRLWLTFVISAMLSAAEMNRVERYHQPPAIVVMIEGGGPRPLRSRPYRAHYRSTVPKG